MSSSFKRQVRKFTAPKAAPATMKGRSAQSANHRAKTGKATVTLAKALPPANEGPK